MFKITKIVLLDILKSKFVLFYTLLLFVMSWSVFNLEDNYAKGILSLLNLILLTIPLVSIMFSTSYLYNSSEFIELLLGQPLQRSRIWVSFYAGLSLALTLAFLVGTGIPVVMYAFSSVGIMMISIGVLITIVFISLAMLCSILTRDKAKGIGLSIVLWLFFALLFDGIVLFLLFQLSDYPIEKMMIGVSALNPIDLSRILILLHLDQSAIMGYSGAIFKDFFGTTIGMTLSLIVLCIWAVGPFLLSLKRFNKNDL